MTDIHNPIAWRRWTDPRLEPGIEAFDHLTKPLRALRSRDLGGRWHLSVSHRDRIPTWEELGEARDALIPEEVFMCVPHPPRRYWINLNRRVLHLWEMRDDALRELFQWEGKQVRGNPLNRPPDPGT